LIAALKIVHLFVVLELCGKCNLVGKWLPQVSMTVIVKHHGEFFYYFLIIEKIYATNECSPKNNPFVCCDLALR
jgi:hypothetical protein